MDGLTPEKMKAASKSAQEESEPACKRRRAAMAHTPRAASVECADAAAPPVVVVASVPAATKGKRVKRQTIGPGAPEPTGGGVARAAESSDDDFEMGETLSEEERARRAKAKAEREGTVQDISDDSVAAGLDASASSSSDSESSSSDSDDSDPDFEEASKEEDPF